jgi:hypothetical protein
MLAGHTAGLPAVTAPRNYGHDQTDVSGARGSTRRSSRALLRSTSRSPRAVVSSATAAWSGDPAEGAGATALAGGGGELENVAVEVESRADDTALRSRTSAPSPTDGPRVIEAAAISSTNLPTRSAGAGLPSRRSRASSK